MEKMTTQRVSKSRLNELGVHEVVRVLELDHIVAPAGDPLRLRIEILHDVSRKQCPYYARVWKFGDYRLRLTFPKTSSDKLADEVLMTEELHPNWVQMKGRSEESIYRNMYFVRGKSEAEVINKIFHAIEAAFPSVKIKGLDLSTKGATGSAPDK
jgi:hypothetical protein